MTEWFAINIVEQIKYRRAEQAKIAAWLAEQMRIDVPYAKGDPRLVGHTLAIQALARQKDAESFKYQAAYLMSQKWIDFGGPNSGKGMNTVRLAGRPFSKNQLGNIELLVIGTVLPIVGGGDLAAVYPYHRVPGTATYTSDHPYAGQYGSQYSGSTRADNVAAFGLGKAIGQKIMELGSWKTAGVPTIAEVQAIIEGLLNDEQSLAVAVNQYSSLLFGSPRVKTDALFFIPRYNGFNTLSLQNPATKPYKGPSSIDYFNNVLMPTYEGYRKIRSDTLVPMELDDWLRWNRENYMNPTSAHPATSAVYWRR